jgi:hypothetical protein
VEIPIISGEGKEFYLVYNHNHNVRLKLEFPETISENFLSLFVSSLLISRDVSLISIQIELIFNGENYDDFGKLFSDSDNEWVSKFD